MRPAPGSASCSSEAGWRCFVPAAAGREKTVAATVMAVSGIRFIITGIPEMNGLAGWMTAAGWVGLILATVSLDAAMAFELEGTDKRAVLPLWRRGDAASAVHDCEAEQLSGVAREPGVRKQL